jgi:hypothetical protein
MSTRLGTTRSSSHIAEIVVFMAEAPEIREIGRKENDLALADAKQAQTAIADATSVIEFFYKGARES